ncbi:MAG: CRISPR-associated protein Cas4 [Bacteroidetes bacterium]|nr:CRISPR-associated protein Cas4 [Bacteroidota bacterium]MBU1717784.1 CRISPR-associated protein Cas4 [Bacteroidota bacterium]
MSSHQLSKSSFIRGAQCLKSLYLYRNFFSLRSRSSPAQLEKFRRGTEVGIAARKIFPGGVDASPASRFQYAKSVEKTKKLIREGKEVIYEAAFVHDDILIALDVLVIQHGKAIAYEVKSSQKLTDTYILDAALQYYVLMGAGVEIDDFFLIHPDTSVVKQDGQDISDVFRTVSVIQQVKEMQELVVSMIERQKEVLALEETPEIEIGKHCNSPYPCDYMENCWGEKLKTTIFRMPGISFDQKADWIAGGIYNANDLPASFRPDKLQSAFLFAEKTKTEFVNKANIKKFSLQVSYPFFIADVSILKPALPLFAGTSAYQEIPVRFAASPFETIDKQGKTSYWVAESTADSRKEFLDKFLKATSTKGKILIADKDAVVKLFEQLAAIFPAYKRKIQNRIDRFISFYEPFEKGYFYAPRQEGEISFDAIGKVLSPGTVFRKKGVKSPEAFIKIYFRLREETDMFEIPAIIDEIGAYSEFRIQTLGKIYITLVERAG